MQLAFEIRTWGGKRKGAGRKPSGRLSHEKRPKHKASQPVHVTLKVRKGLVSLRGHRLARVIGRQFRKNVGRRDDFRVTHFSIQSNHLHLIVEADNKMALSLVYVLQNHVHHGGRPGLDPWSSALWFPHWRQVPAATVDSPVAEPRTWLLRFGWLVNTGGPLDLRELPAEH